MRCIAVILLIIGTFGLSSRSAAQTAPGCAPCVGSYGCDQRRDSCVSECRARLFAVDPRRAECVAECAKRALQCMQTADSSCRAQNACR